MTTGLAALNAWFRKSMGVERPSRKYIQRTGTPGNYRYEYKDPAKAWRGGGDRLEMANAWAENTRGPAAEYHGFNTPPEKSPIPAWHKMAEAHAAMAEAHAHAREGDWAQAAPHYQAAHEAFGEAAAGHMDASDMMEAKGQAKHAANFQKDVLQRAKQHPITRVPKDQQGAYKGYLRSPQATGKKAVDLARQLQSRLSSEGVTMNHADALRVHRKLAKEAGAAKSKLGKGYEMHNTDNLQDWLRKASHEEEADTLRKCYIGTGTGANKEWREKFAYTPLEVEALEHEKERIALSRDKSAELDALRLPYEKRSALSHMDKAKYAQKLEAAEKAWDEKFDALWKRAQNLEQRLLDHKISEAKRRQRNDAEAALAQSSPQIAKAAADDTGDSLRKSGGLPTGEPGLSEGVHVQKPQDGGVMDGTGKTAGPTDSGSLGMGDVPAPVEQVLSSDDLAVAELERLYGKDTEGVAKSQHQVPGEGFTRQEMSHRFEMTRQQELRKAARAEYEQNTVVHAGPIERPIPAMWEPDLSKSRTYQRGIVQHRTSADDACVQLLKAGDGFWADGQGPEPGILRKSHLEQVELCKSCSEVKLRYLTACPHCNSGAVINQVLPAELGGGILEKSEHGYGKVLRPEPMVEPDVYAPDGLFIPSGE